MAFSARREGVEDLSTRDGGAVFQGEALEATQDQAIVGKEQEQVHRAKGKRRRVVRGTM